MRSTFITLFLVAIALAASLGVLQPVDEASRDPSFLQFRTRLLETVRKKDVAGLKAVVDAKINYSFGDNEPGWAGFKKFHEPELPTSELWPSMTKVLTHGGAWVGQAFQAPYVSARWPENLDPYRHGAILGKDVNVRAEPDPNAKPVGTLSYNLVEVVEAAPEFYKIKLPQGGTGYVSERFIEQPIGYRAYFEKKNGAWKMTTFIAGD